MVENVKATEATGQADATTAETGGLIQLTQEQLSERLARKERTAREALLRDLGFESTDALKVVVTAARERETAELSELDRIRKENTALTEKAAQTEQRARATALQAEFKVQAALKGVAHPDDAMALAGDVAQFVSESGQVHGVAEAIDALIAAGRLPTTTARAQAPGLDAGAGSGAAGSKQVKLTDAELAVARRMRLTPEQYAKFKQQ